jgi:hypothetical protein
MNVNIYCSLICTKVYKETIFCLSQEYGTSPICAKIKKVRCFPNRPFASNTYTDVVQCFYMIIIINYYHVKLLYDAGEFGANRRSEKKIFIYFGEDGPHPKRINSQVTDLTIITLCEQTHCHNTRRQTGSSSDPRRTV